MGKQPAPKKKSSQQILTGLLDEMNGRREHKHSSEAEAAWEAHKKKMHEWYASGPERWKRQRENEAINKNRPLPIPEDLPPQYHLGSGLGAKILGGKCEAQVREVIASLERAKRPNDSRFFEGAFVAATLGREDIPLLERSEVPLEFWPSIQPPKVEGLIYKAYLHFVNYLWVDYTDNDHAEWEYGNYFYKQNDPDDFARSVHQDNLTRVVISIAVAYWKSVRRDDSTYRDEKETWGGPKENAKKSGRRGTFTKSKIKSELKNTGGNKSQAARNLGCSVKTIQRKTS